MTFGGTLCRCPNSLVMIELNAGNFIAGWVCVLSWRNDEPPRGCFPRCASERMTASLSIFLDIFGNSSEI